MDCNRCKHRDDESREIDECYEKLYQIAMDGIVRGDKELTEHVLFEIETLHKAIKGHNKKPEIEIDKTFRTRK